MSAEDTSAHTESHLEEELRGEKDTFEEPEDEEEKLQSILSVIFNLIKRAIPIEPKPLTFETASKCLKVLGKIWNLSEYPPSDCLNSAGCKDAEEKLMDMEGYIDEYQYLHIEAVDMSLTDVKVIFKNFIWLLSVDLSGNLLTNRKVCPVLALPNLVALRLDRNIFDDPFFPAVKHLQFLSLNQNQIKSLHKIYHPNLETLALNYNQIKSVDASDCWKHAKLSQLELRGNQLKTTAGIEYQALVNLYLAENRITELKGLKYLVNLERLHLRNNPLYSLSGFSESNIKLKYLNIRECRIASVEEVSQLRPLKGLKELIVKNNVFNPDIDKKELEGSEVEEEEEEEEEEAEGERENLFQEQIRIQILSYLPHLTRIDKKLVTREEILKIRNFFDETGSQ